MSLTFEKTTISSANVSEVAPASLPALLPHNLTLCVSEGRNVSLCAAFHTFNLSHCLGSQSHLATAALAPAAHCLVASGCVELYDVPRCAGPGGFNFSHTLFNKSTCLALAAATNATTSNATEAQEHEGILQSDGGCHLLFGAADGDDESGEVGSDDDEYSDIADDAETSGGPTRDDFHLPRFEPCARALSSAPLSRVTHPFSPYVAPRFPHMSEINFLFFRLFFKHPIFEKKNENTPFLPYVETPFLPHVRWGFWRGRGRTRASWSSH